MYANNFNLLFLLTLTASCNDCNASVFHSFQRDLLLAKLLPKLTNKQKLPTAKKHVPSVKRQACYHCLYKRQVRIAGGGRQCLTTVNPPTTRVLVWRASNKSEQLAKSYVIPGCEKNDTKTPTIIDNTIMMQGESRRLNRLMPESNVLLLIYSASRYTPNNPFRSSSYSFRGRVKVCHFFTHQESS